MGLHDRNDKKTSRQQGFVLALCKLCVTVASSTRLDSTIVWMEGRERRVVLNNVMEHRSSNEETKLERGQDGTKEALTG
jgi:hypothetical protein